MSSRWVTIGQSICARSCDHLIADTDMRCTGMAPSRAKSQWQCVLQRHNVQLCAKWCTRNCIQNVTRMKWWSHRKPSLVDWRRCSTHHYVWVDFHLRHVPRLRSGRQLHINKWWLRYMCSLRCCLLITGYISEPMWLQLLNSICWFVTKARKAGT